MSSISCALLATLLSAGALLLPASRAGAQIAPAGGPYEAPPIFKAADLLTPDQLQGPHHKVREDVTTDGFTNTYIIDSDFGVFYAHGNDLLPERIREIYAIAGIRATKDTEAYGKALSGAAKGTVEGAKNLVKDPVGTVSGIGKGAMRFVKGATERVKTIGDEEETADDLKKFSSAKREIAGRYGVDPYSSNAVLREEIDSLAGATTAGTITFKLLTIAIPGAAGAAVGGISASAELNELLIKEGPYNLRVDNRTRLQRMAIGDYQIEEFLNHPVLNPKHQTVITIALSKLEGARARGEYIRMAMAARSEEDAFFFQRNAELMALYHMHQSRIVEVLDFNGLPAGFTADKKLVLPVLLDYGSWTETGERLAQSFGTFVRSDLEIAGRQWFLSGQLSARAREELSSRGMIVTENAFQTGGN